MEPLKITAYMAGSIAIARPEDIALDGILAYQVLRRHFGAEFYHAPNPQEVLFFARLPLEMRGEPRAYVKDLATGGVWMNRGQDIIDESVWYWSCSSAQIDVWGHGTLYWNKRLDTQFSDHIDFGGKVEKIIIEQGQYKSYHMPLTTLRCSKIVWYVYGDGAQITELLSDVPAIGKKRAYGNGAILKWSVETMPEDCSEWQNGELMRPIPGPLFYQVAPHGLPHDIQHIAFRGPQWHDANQCMCVVRGQRHA